MERRIVDTTYANQDDSSGNYLQLLEEAGGDQKCPFCNLPGDNKLVATTHWWTMIECRWPYENAEVHLILIPNRHIEDIMDVGQNDWGEVNSLIFMAMKIYPTLKIGGGLAVRFGTNSGVTIKHLHFHLIAPVTDEQTGRVIPGKHVNFPIG